MLLLDENDYFVQLPKKYFKDWIANKDYYAPAVWSYLGIIH